METVVPYQNTSIWQITPSADFELPNGRDFENPEIKENAFQPK